MRSSAVRKTRSFSLDPDVLQEVERTKGPSSASERVNGLLKFGLEMERKARLREEAARFFQRGPEDAKARRAFQKAAFRVMSRE